MPVYDVECECGYLGAVSVKLSDLGAWDTVRQCPTCHGGSAQFGRVIRRAPATIGAAAQGSQFRPAKDPNFRRSADYDAMRHKQTKTSDSQQVAAARESVQKGEFEGF